MASRKARRAPRATHRHSSGTGSSITWNSGSSNVGTGDAGANGAFGTWRGAPCDFMGTWSDPHLDAALAFWQFDTGAPYDSWTGSCDVTIGGVWPYDGDSWAAAAAGTYDSRWTTIFQNLKAYWTNKSRGTVYVRPWHEMNGNWMTWSIAPANIADSITAWRRIYAVKQSAFPACQLVFGTSGATVGQPYDWRTLWPGDAYVDVYSTDWYSGHWQLAPNGPEVDGYGGPTGLGAHLAFAAAHGKPMGISEWQDNFGEGGDLPNYMTYMHDFMSANGSKTPVAGKILYDAMFNVQEATPPNPWAIFPEADTSMPLAAARYRTLWAT